MEDNKIMYWHVETDKYFAVVSSVSPSLSTDDAVKDRWEELFGDKVSFVEHCPDSRVDEYRGRGHSVIDLDNSVQEIFENGAA